MQIVLPEGSTGEDIQQAIDSAGRGGKHWRGGAHIILPEGIIPIEKTIVSGGPDANTLQVAMRFTGQGMSDVQMGRGTGSSRGTVLEWRGEKGGTVWRHAGGGRFLMEELAINMEHAEHEQPYRGENAAKYGLELSASNEGGAGIELPTIRRVAIEGSRDDPNTETVALRITGVAENDMVDGGLVEQLFTANVECAVEIDSLMALISSFHLCKFRGTKASVRVLKGSFTAHDCQFNTWSGDGVNLEVGAKAAYIRLMNPYIEAIDQEAIIRVAHGAGGEDRSESYFPLLLVDAARINVQIDSRRGPLPLLDGTIAGPVVFRDLQLKAAGGPGTPEDRHLSVRVTAPPTRKGRVYFDRVHYWNGVRPGRILFEHVGESVSIVGHTQPEAV